MGGRGGCRDAFNGACVGDEETKRRRSASGDLSSVNRGRGGVHLDDGSKGRALAVL